MTDTILSTMKDLSIGLGYNLVYIPALFLYSLGLLFSFTVMLIFSKCNVMLHIENFILNRYTSITRRIHLPKHRTPRQFTPSICFMGGGQLWMFAIGSGHYIFINYDIDKIKFLASSSGCFAAVPLACGLDPYEWCKKDWGKCMKHFASRGILGCLCDTKHFYYQLWDEYLPENAHQRCSGRLFISVTLFPSMKNRVVSHFESRNDLIWTIVASMCLPFAFIRDFPVRCAPELGYCMDGGFSNDAPCLDSYTITVSALHREADIIPVMKPKRHSYGLSEPINSSFTGFNNSDSVEHDNNSLDDNEMQPDDLDASTSESSISSISTKSLDQNDPSNNLLFDRVVEGDGSISISRIVPMDIIRVPQFSRVWEVAKMGEVSSEQCVDFERHEWMTIKKKIVKQSESMKKLSSRNNLENAI
eukprot:gene12821-17191_t